MTDFPEPLTLPEMDMRSLDGFMLNTVQLFSSELWALTKKHPEAFRGAVALWSKAWKQIPAASLPNDDAILAAFADMEESKFKKLRDIVMRGFILCSDGRLYNKTLAAEVCRVWPSVCKTRAGREADKERLKLWRERKRNDGRTSDETDTETRTKRVSSGIERDSDRDTESIKESSLRSESAPKAARTRSQKPAEPEGFAEFYEVYPRKEARPAAAKAFGRALAKVPPEVLIDGAKRYAASRIGEDPKFTKQPATWLNNDCWADQLPLSNDHANGNGHAAPAPSEDDEHRRYVERFSKTGLWPSPKGPPPNDRDCLVPKKILAELGYGART